MNEWNREFFQNSKFLSLTFDDVLLFPEKSEVVPKDVNLETMLSTNIKLNIPIISADMDTVTEHLMAREMAKLGGIGFLWKHPNVKVQEEEVAKVKYTFNAKIDKPIYVRENQTLEDVLKILAAYEDRFSSLIVLNSDGKVVGLLTDNETRFASRADKVKKFMVKKPVCSDENLDISAAYKFMKKRKIGKLILIDKSGKLKGLYCWKDVKDIVENITPLYNRDKRGQLRVGANVGIRDYERAERLLKRHCDVLLVGTAHGHSRNVIETVIELKKNFSRHEFDVIAGNVATYDGARALFEAGADAVKVGLGPGSICTTRVVAGVGVPQITAIYEASKAAAECGKPIIADGGIKYSGDIPKAIAAGASSVMLGSLLAQTDEAIGEIIIVKGKRCKHYRGMGSLGAMAEHESARERYKQESAEKLVPEGIEAAVPLKGPVKGVIYQILGGIQSGMGYVGARNIKELQEKGRFHRQTKAGLAEGHPHDVEIIKEAPNYHPKGE